MSNHDDDSNAGFFFDSEPLEPGLHCMDVVSGMQRIESGTVDLVMMDGPYFISKSESMAANSTGWKGTKYVNFGTWDLESAADMEPAIVEAARILRFGGSVIMWSGWESLPILKDIMTAHGLYHKRKLTWIKPNFHPMMIGKGWAHAEECAIWATKSEGWQDHTFRGVGKSTSWFQNISVRDARDRIHDCQKPVDVYYYYMRELLIPFTGQVVVEPFAGSAPAAAVAKTLGCTYYGFDRDADMVAKARILRGI